MATSKTTTRKTVAPAKARQPVVKKTSTTRRAPVKAVEKASPPKAEKTKKDKLIRDSFTMPKSEYQVLGELKTRAITLVQPAKKSELIRAGIKALAAMSDKGFLQALKAVPPIKTGRPKKA